MMKSAPSKLVQLYCDSDSNWELNCPLKRCCLSLTKPGTLSTRPGFTRVTHTDSYANPKLCCVFQDFFQVLNLWGLFSQQNLSDTNSSAALDTARLRDRQLGKGSQADLLGHYSQGYYPKAL